LAFNSSFVATVWQFIYFSRENNTK